MIRFAHYALLLALATPIVAVVGFLVYAAVLIPVIQFLGSGGGQF